MFESVSKRRGRIGPVEDAGGRSSGGETRTLNLAVNSRLLCRLSYPGWLAGSAYPLSTDCLNGLPELARWHRRAERGKQKG